MPIPLPNLDDRTYADLTAQARTLIPSLRPDWTDHNPSEPGIVLVELLAWLTETLLFQVNEVSAEQTGTFLTLLNGPDWSPPEPSGLHAEIRRTMLHLRARHRAVTPADYEWLALVAWPESEEAGRLDGPATIRRARCLPRRDLSTDDPDRRDAPAPAHVSLVVLAEPVEGDDEEAARRREAVRTALWSFLDPRRVLTTRHHVVEPDHLPVEVEATVALRADALPAVTLDAARKALAGWFHPLTGGPDGTGWPFGRTVHRSEVFALLDGLTVGGAPLVDYVEDVTVTTPAGGERLLTDDDGEVTGLALHDHELVRLEATELVAYDADRRPHR
jgi:hypothetical protein